LGSSSAEGTSSRGLGAGCEFALVASVLAGVVAGLVVVPAESSPPPHAAIVTTSAARPAAMLDLVIVVSRWP
jgi:hypothetical protein